MSLFFVKASAFTFGSGVAIVPFLHQGLVHDHHSLTEQRFVERRRDRADQHRGP